MIWLAAFIVSRCTRSIRDDFLSCSQSYRSPDLGAKWKAGKVLNRESATHLRTANGWRMADVEMSVGKKANRKAQHTPQPKYSLVVAREWRKVHVNFCGTAILRASSHPFSQNISNSQRQILFRPIGALVVYRVRSPVQS